MSFLRQCLLSIIFDQFLINTCGNALTSIRPAKALIRNGIKLQETNHTCPRSRGFLLTGPPWRGPLQMIQNIPWHAWNLLIRPSWDLDVKIANLNTFLARWMFCYGSLFIPKAIMNILSFFAELQWHVTCCVSSHAPKDIAPVIGWEDTCNVEGKQESSPPITPLWGARAEMLQ